MKPTRNIVKPNSNLWKAKGKVWYQKNDDTQLAKDLKEDYEGQEFFVPEYEDVVGFSKGKIISGGKVVGKINKSNASKLMKAKMYDEYGTTDFKTIMRREGFEV